MQQCIGFGFQDRDLDECSETLRQAHNEVDRIVAIEELADVLTDLQSRMVDLKGHRVKDFGCLLQYDPLVDLARPGRNLVSWVFLSELVTAFYFLLLSSTRRYKHMISC